MNQRDMRTSFLLAAIASSLLSIVHSQDLPALTPVNYTHDEVELQGFMTVPNEEGVFPAVVIIP